MKWISNRDMRDKNYTGDFVIELSDDSTGFKTKEEALDSMKKILVGDLENFKLNIKESEEKIQVWKDKIEKIKKRLTEIQKY